MSSKSASAVGSRTSVVAVAGVAALVISVAAAAFIVSRKNVVSGDGAVRGSTSSPPTKVTEKAPAAAPREIPVDPPLPDSDRARAMELLQVLKQRANAAFQQGRYEEAVAGYQDCISVTSALGAKDKEAVTAEQVIRANVVMAFIKLHQYADARLVATMLLQEDAERGFPLGDDLKVKVLYRRGLASKSLGDRDAALADFRAAVQLSPGGRNDAAAREITLLGA